MPIDEIACPVCSGRATKEGLFPGSNYRIRCPRCTGRNFFTINRAALINLESDNTRRTPRFIAAFAFIATRSATAERGACFDEKSIEELLSNPTPYNPAEQADNLILLLGDRSQVGEEVHVDPRCPGFIGAYDENGFRFLVREIEAEELISADDYSTRDHITLTLKGWQRFEELKKGRALGRNVLMAMQYGLESVDRAFAQCFQPAVKSTGFNLYKLIDNPKAGIIDNHLTVALLTSRFVVADLTKNNRGAYWEAGFAEGQSKPVFYTCERNYFRRIKTHFDTRHRQTILWQDGKWESAIKELRDTIRGTLSLRDEVIMEP